MGISESSHPINSGNCESFRESLPLPMIAMSMSFWGLEINLQCSKNGNFSEESSPLHTFTEDGTYEVCLTVTCDSGYVSTNCETIVIENGANLRAISGTVNHDGYTEEIINSLEKRKRANRKKE